MSIVSYFKSAMGDYADAADFLYPTSLLNILTTRTSFHQ